MDLLLRDKIAIVTGASEGIGKAIAIGLARENAKVAICARRSDVLSETAAEIRDSTGTDVLAIPTDVTLKEEVKKFIKEVLDRWKTVHILINNVGFAKKALFEELTDAAWHDTFEANIFSALYCTEFVLPVMKQQRWGRIINISAVSGREPSFNLLASNVAKSGVISLTKSLANEVGKYNILVNCVCPGRILTPQISRLYDEKKRQELAQTETPLGRFGTSEELANLVVFLTSERASYITGTTTAVDGGIVKSLY